MMIVEPCGSITSRLVLADWRYRCGPDNWEGFTDVLSSGQVGCGSGDSMDANAPHRLLRVDNPCTRARTQNDEGRS